MKKSISESIPVLEKHLREIRTVAEWADHMGYKDPSYFSRKFRDYHKSRPKEYIKWKKMGLFNELIQKDPPLLNYEIALALGLKDEAALYKYIRRHTGNAPAFWKENGRIPIDHFIP